MTGSERRADGVRITRQGLAPLTTEEIAAEIQRDSSLTRGDVIHVINELQDIKFHVVADNRSIVSQRDSIPLVRDWFDSHDVITMLNYATLCHCSHTTARRRIASLLATHHLERLPHSTTCYVPGINLYSTTRP